MYNEGEKKEMLFMALMISMFSGYSMKEISSMDKDQITSYIETFKRAQNFEEN